MKVMLSWLYFVLPLVLLIVPASAQDSDSGDKAPESSNHSAILLDGMNSAEFREENIFEFIRIAFEKSPRIAAARAEWNAAAEKYPQMKSWPDPLLDFEWMPKMNDFSVQLMQMIPNPKRLNIQGDKAVNMAETAQVKYEKVVRDVIIDTTKSYLELGYLYRAQKIAETNRELFSQLVELALLRESQNELGISERHMAEARHAQAEYEVGLFRELLESESAGMRLLLGLEPDAEIPYPVLPFTTPLTIDLQTIRQLVLEHRQELQMAGLSVEMAQLDLSLAKALRQPDYSIGFMYNKLGEGGGMEDEGAASGGEDSYALMFGINIPIWGGKNKARIEEAQSELDAANANLENMTLMATSSVDRLYWQLNNQGRLLILYRDTLLPEARQASELSQTWYESDMIPFSQLVEARLVVTNFELASARATADYLQTLAELERLIGVPLPVKTDSEVSIDE